MSTLAPVRRWHAFAGRMLTLVICGCVHGGTTGSADTESAHRQKRLTTMQRCCPGDVGMLLLDARDHPGSAAPPTVWEANLTAVLQQDPTQPLAVAWLAKLRKSSPVNSLRQSVAARPNDWRAWLLLGQALPGGPDREAAFRKAVVLNPDSAMGNNQLAWELMTRGRAKEAFPFADHAVDLAPGDAAIVDTLAVVADGLGKCKDALALAHRAADLVRRREGEITQHLAAYEKGMRRRCPIATPSRVGGSRWFPDSLSTRVVAHSVPTPKRLSSGFVDRVGPDVLARLV
jgi:Flp pilus assembly protein TadD